MEMLSLQLGAGLLLVRFLAMRCLSIFSLNSGWDKGTPNERMLSNLSFSAILTEIRKEYATVWFLATGLPNAVRKVDSPARLP